MAYTVGMRPICFISDYGLAGELVGSCKGVMAGIARGAPVVDITHSIPGFDAVRAPEILRHTTRCMPKDAVYPAVLEPGDRFSRRALGVQAQNGA